MRPVLFPTRPNCQSGDTLVASKGSQYANQVMCATNLTIGAPRMFVKPSQRMLNFRANGCNTWSVRFCSRCDAKQRNAFGVDAPRARRGSA